MLDSKLKERVTLHLGGTTVPEDTNEVVNLLLGKLDTSEAARTELSRAATPKVIDPEVMADRASMYVDRIELARTKGDVPTFMADKLKKLVNDAAPNVTLLSRADGATARPIDDILALFDGAQLGKAKGEITGNQSFTLSRVEPDAASPAINDIDTARAEAQAYEAKQRAARGILAAG